MERRLVVAVAVVALGAAPALAQQAARRPAVDVQYYHFDIDIPDTGTIVRGRAAIGFVRSGAGDDTLRLDLVGMEIGRAHV